MPPRRGAAGQRRYDGARGTRRARAWPHGTGNRARAPAGPRTHVQPRAAAGERGCVPARSPTDRAIANATRGGSVDSPRIAVLISRFPDRRRRPRASVRNEARSRTRQIRRRGWRGPWCAGAAQHRATGAGPHAETKAVLLLPLPVVRLVRPLHAWPPQRRSGGRGWGPGACARAARTGGAGAGQTKQCTASRDTRAIRAARPDTPRQTLLVAESPR